MEASTLVAVPPSEGQSWPEIAAADRERIRALEKESDRHRDALHTLRTEAMAVRYLAERVADLATDVKAIAGRIETVAERALQRPSSSALSVLAQYLSFGVAIVALVIALTR